MIDRINRTLGKIVCIFFNHYYVVNRHGEIYCASCGETKVHVKRPRMNAWVKGIK